MTATNYEVAAKVAVHGMPSNQAAQGIYQTQDALMLAAK
jgi:hypothetical protein